MIRDLLSLAAIATFSAVALHWADILAAAFR